MYMTLLFEFLFVNSDANSAGCDRMLPHLCLMKRNLAMSMCVLNGAQSESEEHSLRSDARRAARAPSSRQRRFAARVHLSGQIAKISAIPLSPELNRNTWVAKRELLKRECSSEKSL